MRVRDGVLVRLLCVREEPIVGYAWQIRSGEVRFRVSGNTPRRGTGGGARADAVHARRRRRNVRVLRRVQARRGPRPGAASPALDPSAPAPVAVGGARGGDHRAADRGLAGGRDRAADGRGDGGAVEAPRPGVGLLRECRAGGHRRPRPGRARRDGPLRRPVDRDDPAALARSLPAASTSPCPGTTSTSSESARSARGQSSAWAFTAAASPTRCPPATSPTSSSSAASPVFAAAPPCPRSRSTSSAFVRSAASPGSSPRCITTRPSRRARRCGSRPRAMSKANVEALRPVYEAWGKGDWSPRFAVYSPDMEWGWSDEFPGLAGVSRDFELRSERLREWLSPWDDWRCEVEEFVTSGSHVVALTRYRGRGKGSQATVDSLASLAAAPVSGEGYDVAPPRSRTPRPRSANRAIRGGRASQLEVA